MTFILYMMLIISLTTLIVLKINRKNNRYVIIFSLLLGASVTLEFLSLYPPTNYAILWFNVSLLLLNNFLSQIYYYETKDSNELLSFALFYNMNGYVYYSCQILFLLAHWLFGFVYLFTAVKLGFQLQFESVIYKR